MPLLLLSPPTIQYDAQGSHSSMHIVHHGFSELCVGRALLLYFLGDLGLSLELFPIARVSDLLEDEWASSDFTYKP